VKRLTPYASLMLLGPAVLSTAGKSTTTDPPIDLAHIGYGEINGYGEAVGYHHRPSGVDPPGARVQRVVQPADASGVYRARVALRDPATGAWIDKKAPNFFPDAMSDHEVIDGSSRPSARPQARRRSAHRRFGSGLRGRARRRGDPKCGRRGCPAERYSRPELRAAIETWIAAVERARRSTDPTALP
jgi:Bacterial EndoU nuclease